MALNHLPVRATLKPFFSCPFVSSFFHPFCRFAVLSSSFEILLYPFFHGSSHVTNEPEPLSSAHYVLVMVNYVRKYRVTVSPIVNGRAHPRGEFLLGRRGTARDKTDVLIGVPPLAFPIAKPELRSAFNRIVLNAYLRAALPRAMHEEPRVIAGVVDE